MYLSIRAAGAGPVLAASVVVVGLSLAAGAGLVLADTADEPIHEHPEDLDGDGDAEAVADWLRDRLSSKLGNSTVEISEGQYDRAAEQLGDEYDQRLSEYVSVAGDTGREEDEQAAETFEEAQDTQRDYAETSRTFEETLAAYESAIEDGDEARARELYRELADLVGELEDTGAELTDAYHQLENVTDTDQSAAVASTQAHTNESTRTFESLDDLEFEDTVTRASTASRTISVADPLVVSGHVRTELGVAVDEGTVRIEVGGQHETVELASDGTFTGELQPVNVSRHASTATVSFEPEPRSTYNRSDTAVPIEVEPVEPDLVITDAPTETRYGENVTVAGALAVEGAPLPDVPLAITIGGEELDGTMHRSNGTFEFVGAVGSEPADGPRALEVRVAYDDRAVVSTAAAVDVMIEETGTQLHLETRPDEEDFTAGGVLETAAGTPLQNASVRLYVDGNPVETVETDANGRFTSSGIAGDADDLTVRATFDGSGTNLASSEAIVEPPASLWIIAWISDHPAESAAVAAAVVLGLAVAYFAHRRGVFHWIVPEKLLGAGVASRMVAMMPFRGGSDDPDVAAPKEAPTEKSSNPTDADHSADGAWIESACRHYRSGDVKDAIATAYVGTRAELSLTLENGAQATHWEFFEECCAADLPPSAIDSLETLTRTYERATFAPAAPTPAEAKTAIDAASAVVDATSHDVELTT